jgi:FAD:protein FMN transferase
MSKMYTDPLRHALNGPTMGTRWSALFHATPSIDPARVCAALQAAVDDVDTQMSVWKPESDLMRLNAAPVGKWVTGPAMLIEVLRRSLEIGHASKGAFDIGVGDVVTAWGFGAEPASSDRIRAAITMARVPAYEALELDALTCRVRKQAPIAVNLNGIAKGYGVDRLAEVLMEFGIDSGLVGIDGEMRALGLRPDGAAWAIAVEAPDPARRAPHSILALQDAAVATSGDYRHWVDVGGRRLSHTVDPVRGGPLATSPASVSVVAATCVAADAWATALMVLGSVEGAEMARRHNLDVLFIDREGDNLRETRVGGLFGV